MDWKIARDPRANPDLEQWMYVLTGKTLFRESISVFNTIRAVELGKAHCPIYNLGKGRVATCSRTFESVAPLWVLTTRLLVSPMFCCGDDIGKT